MKRQSPIQMKTDGGRLTVNGERWTAGGFTALARLLFALLLWFVAQAAMAQQPVNLTPMLAPPYSPYLADYLDQAVITLTNNTSNAIALKLVGSLENEDGQYVRTADGWQPGMAVTLQPFQTRTIFAESESQNFLDPQNVETNLTDQQQISIARTGIIPEGVYTFCVQALDFQTGAPLSAQAPQGCQTVIISYPEPPALTSPMCETEVTMALPVFTWTPPIGNLAGAAIRYDYYLLKLLPGQEPNDAMNLAINYNAGNPLKISNLLVNSYSYKPSDPPLVDNANYAWAVVARDANHKIVIQNGGRSEVCTFVWKKPGKFNNDPPGAVVNNPNNNDDPEDDDEGDPPPPPAFCATECAFDLSDPGFPSPDLTGVAIDSVLKMGTFNMKVIQLDPPDPWHPGTISGRGLIPLPFANVSKISVRVHFDSVKLNTEGRVIEGTARALVHPGAMSLMPDFDQTSWDGFSMDGATLTTLKEWIEGQIDSAKQNLLMAYDTYGWEMPLGYGSDGHSLALTKMFFTPTSGQFSAVAVVNLPNFTGAVTPLSFGAANICFASDDICQEGKLFLAQDFGVDIDGGQPGYELTLNQGQPDPNDNTGTWMTFDTSGIGIFHLAADYALPPDKVQKADGTPGAVKLHFEAQMDSLSDWLFSAVAPDFQILGNKDFTFMPDTVWIDLSDASNPPAPSDSIIYMNLYADPTWTGVFCKQLAVQALTPLNNGPDPSLLQINDLFIDTSGVTVNIFGENLIDLTTGTVESFNFSVDTLNVQIQHNSFILGKFNGKMLINIADRNYASNQIVTTNTIPFSCLITNTPDPDPNAPVGSKVLAYQFAMQPVDSIVAPIWAFNLTILPTSHLDVNNVNGAFQASALLDGTFGISPTLPLIGTSFVGIAFQGLGLTSQSPYFSMGSISLACPQHALSGFPVTLNDFEFVQKDGLFGMQFDIGLKLSDLAAALPSASTKFTIYGRLFDANMKVKPAYDHFELNEICLNGDFSVLHIDGCVKFFHEDATFGDGFLGNLNVKFPPGVKVAATMQFGNVNNYNYWYADAMAILPTGIPMFAGVELFGFGGGAYYHMQRTPDVVNYDFASTANFDPSTQPTPGMSPAGITYVPNQSVDLGIKAKVYIGSQGQRDVFNCDVALEVAFENGGLGKIWLDGNARFASDEDMKKGAVTGELHAFLDVPKEVFTTSVSAKLSFEVISAQGTLEMLFDGLADGNPGTLNWHVRLGRPIVNDPSKWVSLTFFDAYTIQTYFQIGNFEVDDMPPPPAFVTDLVGQEFAQSASARTGMGNGSSLQIIHGGRTTFSYGGKFLIFYGQLDAGMGYDLLLKKVTKNCDGTGDGSDVGMDGWYANGQAYAGFKGSIGLDVDLGFVAGRYEIAAVGIAALVQAGFVNPTWADGAIGGEYSIFDGLIEGKFNYKVSVGQKCVIPDADPLGKIELVSDVFPPDGKQNADVTTMTSAATVLKMDKTKEMHFTQKMAKNTTKHHLYRFGKDLMALELTKNGAAVATFAPEMSADGYGLTWVPKTTLDKLANYQAKFIANVEQCETVAYDAASKHATCTGIWKKAERDGKVFEEIHLSKFKTNNGLDSIPESLIEFTMPYQRERTFLWQKNDNGQANAKPAIVMSQGFNPNSYNIGPAGAQLSYKFKFIPLSNNAAATSKTVDFEANGTKIIGEWPAGQLQTNTYYAIQFLASWQAPQQPQQPSGNNPNGTDFTTREVKSLWNAGMNWANLTTTKLVANKLIVPPNSAKLYEIRFKTSQYPNIEAKLEAMKAVAATYSVRPQNPAASAKNVNATEAMLNNPAQLKAHLNQAVGNPAGALPAIGYLPNLWMKGPEKFDCFDINGYYKKMPNGKEVVLPPFLQYTKNSPLDDFHHEMLVKLQKNLVDGGFAAQDFHTIMPGSSFEYSINAPCDGPIGWNDGIGAQIGNLWSGGGIWGNAQFIMGQQYGMSNQVAQLPSSPYWWWTVNDWYTLKFITTFSHSNGWVPVAIDPYVFVGDIVQQWEFPVDVPEETYTRYLQRLGMSIDIVNQHWGTFGGITLGYPVLNGGIRFPGGGTGGGGFLGGFGRK